MNLSSFELSGERALVVSMVLEHFEGLLAAAQDPSIWTWMPQDLRAGESMRSWMDSAFKTRNEGRECPFVIIDRASGTIVGSTRYLDIDPPHRSLEIGWTWLSPTVWRTCINTECKYLLLRNAFETLGAIRVQLKTDARNERSRRAIERIGGVFEGILRSHRILSDGSRRDSAHYSILDSEWSTVRERLESFLAS